MNYPSMEEIENADREQVYKWFLQLPAPKHVKTGRGKNIEYVDEPPGGFLLFKKIYLRWLELGGRDPAMAEKILKKAREGNAEK